MDDASWDGGDGGGDTDFETSLAALDREREESLRVLMRALSSRLYGDAPPDLSARVGDAHGTFAVAPPEAELEWRLLNGYLRVVGQRALEHDGIRFSTEAATPGSGGEPSGKVATAEPTTGSSRPSAGAPPTSACPDCALFAQLNACFKAYDDNDAGHAAGTAAKRSTS